MNHTTEGRRRCGNAAVLALLASLGGGLGCGGKAASDREEPEPRAGTPSAQQPLPEPGPVPEQRPIADTCEENPLLPECPAAAAASCPANPLACPVEPPQPPQPPVPTRRSEDTSLPQVVRIEALLDENCGSCHGAQARRQCSPNCEGMMYIDDMSQLLETEKLIPCDWNRSPIGQRLSNSSMPPPISGMPPMPSRDQLQLRVFVENMCTDLTYPGNTGRINAEQLLRDSCGSCHGEAPADGGAPPGGLARVDDVPALIEGGFLIPCRSEASPIIGVLRSGSMPPADSGIPQLSLSAIDGLAAFIDRPCAR